MISIRGAIDCQNTQNSITQATKRLVCEVFAQNKLNTNDIVAIIFTTTSDISAANPATVFRTTTGVDDVSLLCVQEANFTNSPPNLIRILVLSNQDIPKKQICHCYLDGAKNLRKDLASIELEV